MNSIRLPFLRIAHAYHLGSMQAGRKGENYASSYEGPCLSVSLCPNAWERIARLGGSNLHRLEREGALFLDVLRIDARTKRQLLNWAVDEGHAEIAPKWRLRQWDPDQECWSWMDYDSLDEAKDELEYADEGSIRKRREHVLTAAGAATSGGKAGDPAFDMICLIHLRDIVRPQAPGAVGLWWTERYSPETLSAPRGGVLPECVQEFDAATIPHLSSVDDEDEIDEMLAPVFIDFTMNEPTLHPRTMP